MGRIDRFWPTRSKVVRCFCPRKDSGIRSDLTTEQAARKSSGGKPIIRPENSGVEMVPRRWKLRRFGVHAGSFLLGTILSGILGTVILGLSLREFGLLVTALALTIIFFFEVLYQHNVRIGRIPEDRAEALRVLMLPMVYLAAVGLLFPFLDAPGFDSTARFAIILAFPALTLCAIGWRSCGSEEDELVGNRPSRTWGGT